MDDREVDREGEELHRLRKKEIEDSTFMMYFLPGVSLFCYVVALGLFWHTGPPDYVNYIGGTLSLLFGSYMLYRGWIWRRRTHELKNSTR
jgi:hypothetical protein